MDNTIIKKNTRELESFVKKAKRKLLEFEVAKSEWETMQGKSRVFKSVSEFMNSVKSRA